MTAFIMFIGIFVMAILVVHIYLTNNIMEKSCADLHDGVVAYYAKNLDEKLEEEAKEKEKDKNKE
ncbi:MAG: hypothetical protein FWF51_00740 [Chitinivibrionia bacterium]|nr:hypothetical protein [Chitinivibrionia bacterium]